MATMVQRHRCFIELPDGPARRVGDAGLVIGRQRDCDIVATDSSVSRRHALVHATPEGIEVVPLGQALIKINGKSHTRAAPLVDGDLLALPGLSLVVRIETDPSRDPGTASFRLELGAGGSFGLMHTPFVIGGGDNNDLIMKGWPDPALRFHLAQGELYVEVVAGKARRNRDAMAAGAIEPVTTDDVVEYQRETFRVTYEAGDALTTVHGTLDDVPTRVVIEMLPRGGRVLFTVRDGVHGVFLADRRLDLTIALLRPPAEYRPGDFIPDDVIRSIVWPRNPAITRPEINTLISRCRRDLVAAGLSGSRLLERAQGGGATRLAIAPGAEIELR